MKTVTCDFKECKNEGDEGVRIESFELFGWYSEFFGGARSMEMDMCDFHKTELIKIFKEYGFK